MKRGRFLEILVARLQTALHPVSASIQSPGMLSEIVLEGRTRPREFDILITYNVADYQVRVACEVKEWKRPVGISEIQAFNAKCSACGVDRRIFVSASGFTADAIKRALIVRVELRHVNQLMEIPESIITQVELRYHRTCLFPQTDISDALMHSNSTSPDYMIMSDQGFLTEPLEVVARARLIHGQLYHEHFISGRSPFTQAKGIVEPMTIVPETNFKIWVCT